MKKIELDIELEGELEDYKIINIIKDFFESGCGYYNEKDEECFIELKKIKLQ